MIRLKAKISVPAVSLPFLKVSATVGALQSSFVSFIAGGKSLAENAHVQSLKTCNQLLDAVRSAHAAVKGDITNLDVRKHTVIGSSFEL